MPLPLERVTCAEPQVLAFLLANQRQLFAGRLASGAVPADLRLFSEHYGRGRGCLLLVRDAAGEPVASIAYRPYDCRFPQLAYVGERVVEVARLFVAPQYRRQGLARRLFQALLIEAAHDGVERLYLHTHPFLPGAEAFWLGQGFQVVARETALPWLTLHLDRRLAGAQASAGPRHSR
ncbi:GNAT family N-acetyltransferase [Pseudomonas sp. EpS/L25]|uniref:GNAT family N-acetyltransferase n=1 Tax=Pseudomonas sp. EpS/L25 TaxID=1749078 RepID=UPI001F312821|nr:GNAT family N-acetyltransferase [Pseudomonas sp. EpS/L25]